MEKETNPKIAKNTKKQNNGPLDVIVKEHDGYDFDFDSDNESGKKKKVINSEIGDKKRSNVEINLKEEIEEELEVERDVNNKNKIENKEIVDNTIYKTPKRGEMKEIEEEIPEEYKLENKREGRNVVGIQDVDPDQGELLDSYYFEDIDSPRIMEGIAKKDPLVSTTTRTIDTTPTFNNMRVLNFQSPSRIIREPVYKWEKNIGIGDALQTKKLQILATTWNLHGETPDIASLKELLRPNIKHHLYVIGSEECLRSIEASLLNQNKKIYEKMLQDVLGDEYVMIKSHSLMATHLIVFIQKPLVQLVNNIESDSVRVGINNVVGNKGGIGISLKIGSMSFLFASVHLASGQRRAARRNEDFFRIEQQLRNVKPKDNSLFRVSDRVDVCIYLGDLNSRTNADQNMVKHLIEQSKYEVILINDHLNLAKKGTALFKNFNEGEIMFAPTYKYKPGEDYYDYAKGRIPAYADRVLYKYKTEGSIEQISYDSNNNCKMSDHRPVFSQFICNFEFIEEVVKGIQLTPEKVDTLFLQKKKTEGSLGKSTKSSTCFIF